MRNFLLLLAFTTVSIFSATIVSAQYCTTGLYTTQGCGDDDYINSFSTTGGASNITNNNTGCSNTGLDAYTYYSSMTHSSVQGTTVNFSVSLSPDWSEGIKIWVDYNNDGDFDDADELVYSPTGTVAAGSPAQTGSFVIPATTVPGQKRMRVRCVFSTTTFGPCTQHGYGEIEDYNLNVIASTPCNGMPNAGTITATPSPVCASQPVSLNVTGTSLLGGLQYQWQVSTVGVGGPFNDITGATNLSASTTQTVTSWYRLKVTCTNTNDIAYSNVVSVSSPPVPTGTYTIGAGPTTWNVPPGSGNTGGTNFATFQEAIDAMACGIGNGGVIFNVTPGTYNEQLIIPYVLNTSPTNTVTFNGNGATLTYATTAAQRAVVKLNGTDYFRFDNFIINPTGTANGYGFHLVNNADSNIISNCIINGNTTSTSTSFAGIAISGSQTDAIGTGTTTALNDGNIIKNNTIKGGYYGVTLTATFAGGANGNNQITGNHIEDFQQYGVYVAGSYNTVVDSNYISRPTRTVSASTVQGIYFTSQSNSARITRNRITNPFGGIATPTQAFYGIDFNSASASSGNDNYVVNNVIAQITGNGTIYAINNNASGNVSYFHNTISLDNAAATAGNTRGFNQSGTASGLVFYDNMISITRGGSAAKYAVYIGGSLFSTADYNNYYVNASTGYIGYYTGNRATLTDWRNATSAALIDVNSWDLNPVFNNPATGDYCAANAGIDGKGLYIGIDYDINGNTRSFTNPDIGAFECTPPPCSVPPVSGITMVNPTSTCQNTPVVLDLNIGAYGSGQTFQWQWADDATPTVFNNLGTPQLTPGLTINADSTVWLQVLISCGASTVTTTPVKLTVSPAFPGGFYTIDNTQPTNYVPGQAGANFHSFNDAYNAMASCGITGPVVFDVFGNSPYNEQLVMDSIKGASEIWTVTFNGNGRTISFTPTVGNERAVIKLKRADHIIFDSLTIDASSGASFGYGVQLINNADSNVFRKCTIVTSTTSSSSAFAGVVINATDAGPISAGNTLCDDNLFDKNTIIGGYYGVTIVGGNNALINRNRFTNNTVQDFFSTGFYISGTNSTLIESNTIERPTRSSFSTTYGIYATSLASDNLLISKNRIRNLAGGLPTSASSMYGIYHNSVDADALSPSVVSNNLISNMGGNGLMYGLYNVSSDNVYYYHNTVSLDSSNSTATAATRGFYQQATATGVEFKNNIITIRRGGNGAKHAIYIDNATSVTSDYNDFFVEGNNAHVGWYAGANRTTLADWQTASTKDANSLNLDPLYQNPATGDFRPAMLPLDNKGTTATAAAITTDIVNTARNNPPDMGAFEFSAVACANPPVAGDATVTPNSGLCLLEPITLNVINHSPLGSLTFQWQTSATGAAGTWTNIGPLQYSPRFDTLTMPTSWFRAAVTCNGNTQYTTPVQVIMNNYLLAGTYTIGNGATTWPGSGQNFATWQEAVSALMCGIGGPIIFNVYPGTYTEQIRIPNIRNTSAVNTVTFQSNNGNAATTKLSWASTTGTSNYTLKLDTASYFRFYNLSFEATDPTFARAIEFDGLASYDSIAGCTITVPAVATTSNIASGIYASGFKGTTNVIKGNTINNGAMGIYWFGINTTTPSYNHVIDSNTINGAYFYGIYASNQINLKVQKNTVNVTAPLAANSYGIYMNACDTSYDVIGNKINVSNATTAVYGIYMNNCDKSLVSGNANINNNIITAATGNTGNITGIYVSNAGNTGVTAHNVMNNAITISTTATVSYGIYNNNTSNGKYYNNSVNVGSANGTVTNAAARFDNSAAVGLTVRNNIFSNTGGGRALYVYSSADPSMFNYNMLYTTGSVLVQRANPAGTYADLNTWNAASNSDKYSISYAPAFVSSTDLHPDLANPDVWAMHGRGVQITGNDADINGNYRPQTLTEGVPDLGAYEFYPTALPTILTAVPAAPAANTSQVFMYGTDTVMKIKWGNNVPATITAQRYSGVVPPTPPAYPGTDSMYFYTQVNVPGGLTSNYDYKMELFYLDPWQGSIPDQYMIGLGRRTASSWVVGFGSRVNTVKKVISDSLTAPIDKFTGFINPYAPPVLPEKDSSNRGRRFWVAYAINQLNGGQDMVLYLSAQEDANVTVKINGTSWIRNYVVPAGTVTVTEILPKAGAQNAFLNSAGLFDQGISIESDVPIVAYGHCYGSASSGAVMLLPVGVWGYEYKTLGITQDYGLSSYSYFYVIADNDNTVVEVTPSVAVQNAGMSANVPYTVTLNRGQVFQVVASSQIADLTGSTVKSLPNSQGKCYPVATFSGSSRTAIDVGQCGSGGDFIMQQNFPSTAWGKRYLTAPTSLSTAANTFAVNVFRVAVKDPLTVVTRNGVQLTGLVGGHYYEFTSSTPDYIEADKPIMVAQFEGGACAAGDPEMFYISPIEQGINSVAFYRNTQQAITRNYVTLIVPTGGTGLSSLVIKDGPTVQTPDVVIPHPNLPGYSVVIKGWGSAQRQVTVTCDSAFTGITYGQGSVESYGYNVGTLVKNINALGTIRDTLSILPGNNEFTCQGAPLQFTAYLPVIPTSLTWKFSSVPGLSPNNDVTITNPTPSGTVYINNTLYYKFALTQAYTFSNTGVFSVQINYQHPDIESCDHTGSDLFYVQVVPSPKTDFTISFPGCEGNTATFNAEATTANGITVSQWQWTFHDNTTASGQTSSYTYNTAGTYNVKLHTITPDGCIGDSIKPVTVNARPVISVVADSIAICSTTDTTFRIQSPVSGTVYNWYTSATGGTPITTGGNYVVGASGVSLTVQNVTTSAAYYVEAVSAQGCASVSRKRVKVELLAPLTPAVVTNTGADINSITFSWSAVPGAASYQVSIDNGANWTNPSSGATGLTHTIGGLAPLQQVCIIVRAIGVIACQTSESAPVCASTKPDGIFIPNTFTPNGDGKNDVLAVYGFAIQSVEFMVFNQWGEKIHEVNSSAQNSATGGFTVWDGKYKGKVQPTGVYVYAARITLKDGTIINKSGALNIVR